MALRAFFPVSCAFRLQKFTRAAIRSGGIFIIAAAALMSVTASRAFAQLPSSPAATAVYVTGGADVTAKTKEALGAGILNALVSGGRYNAAQNGGLFVSEAAARQSKQPAAPLTGEQISEIAAQFGIQIVCVAGVVPAANGYHVQIHAIETQTSNVVSLGVAFSPLRLEADFIGVSEELARQMSSGRDEAQSESVSVARSAANIKLSRQPLLSTVAVYVTGGEVPARTKESLGAGITNALVSDKRYGKAPSGVNFITEVVAREAKEPPGGALTGEQIGAIAAEFGVGYVCVAVVIPAFEGTYHIQARTIDAQTAKVVSLGGAFSSLKSDAEIIDVSEKLARQMAVGRVEPEPQPAAEPEPAPAVAYTPPPPAPPDAYSVAYTPPPSRAAVRQNAYEESDEDRKSTNGFSLGYGFSGKKSSIIQVGFAQAHPIGQNVASFVWETNVWIGSSKYSYGYYYNYEETDYEYSFVGVNIPLLFQFDLGFLAVEAGAQLDALYHERPLLFNAGSVVGTGISLNRRRTHKIFYRFNYGITYYSHMYGLRLMF
jgi:hypothetical protein